MNRRRFVKSAGWGTAGLLLNSDASKTLAEPMRAYPSGIAQPTERRVLVRWTEPELPAARTLGVHDLVIPWGANRPLLDNARKQGYHVYAAATLEQASRAADAGSGMGLSGIIVEAGESRQKSAEEIVTRLRLAHPNLSFLIPGPGAKQPAMKGTTITNQGGILEVSSPTAQPWIDSNFANVAFDRAIHRTQIPLINFPWELSDTLQQQQGPSADAFCLAVAEAGALRCDLILNLHPNFQKALGRASLDEWNIWKHVMQYVHFYFKEGMRPAALQANVGVVTDNYDASYETTNLMARNNIPFRILSPRDLIAQGLTGLDLIVMFAQPDEAAVKQVAGFVTAGGVAILVGLRGPFPWQSAGASQSSDHAVTYAAGKGKVFELYESAADPGTFALDVRRLLGKENSLISLWNATTVLAAGYSMPGSSDSTLELVNYSADPLAVQVRVKRAYSAVRYEAPERDHNESLKPAIRDGFTEFVVPSLRIGGRVHLGPLAGSSPPPVVVQH